MTTTAPLVLVTESEFRKGEQVFRAARDLRCVVAPSGEAELAADILRLGARHAVVGHLPYRGPLYTALRPGSVLARFGVGHDGIDKVKATAAGLRCTNTPGVLDQSVAELTMLLIAAAARHLTSLAGAMQTHAWSPRGGAELRGQTLAIVGCGRIGRAVGRIAAAGFQMRVIGFGRPGIVLDPDLRAAGFQKVTDDFGAAVAAADYVSLHVPALPENARFINRDRLSLLRPDAWLINTARGAVVDESALFDALAGQRIAGAALDVFEREPYEPVSADQDFRTLANVILTPHVGSNTTEANRQMGERALQNIRLAEAGRFAEMDLLN